MIKGNQIPNPSRHPQSKMRSVSMEIEVAEMQDRARQVDDRLTFGAIALSCSRMHFG